MFRELYEELVELEGKIAYVERKINQILQSQRTLPAPGPDHGCRPTDVDGAGRIRRRRTGLQLDAIWRRGSDWSPVKALPAVSPGFWESANEGIAIFEPCLSMARARHCA